MRNTMVFMLFLFFFSSRRRHTRSKRDWSSDVCSSDLPSPGGCDAAPAAWSPRREPRLHVAPRGTAAPGGSARADLVDELDDPGEDDGRSEERRVGKEGRTRG